MGSYDKGFMLSYVHTHIPLYAKGESERAGEICRYMDMTIGSAMDSAIGTYMDSAIGSAMDTCIGR